MLDSEHSLVLYNGTMIQYIVGVDEAGRGPLAGPVAVGAVCVKKDFDWKLISGVGDSKQLSPKNRTAIFRLAKELKQANHLDFCVAMTGPELIDQLGIVRALARAKARAIRTVARAPEETHVKLDGLLTAPAKYLYQETIIKGDQKEKVIGLASILAKVKRDEYMRRIGDKPQFAAYNFSKHKGYGTQKHRELIAKHGLSVMHRRSFCQRLPTQIGVVQL